MKSADDAIREFPELVKQLADVDRTPDKRYLYRICQMFANKEASITELKSIFIERAAICQYLTNDEVDGKDIYSLALDNDKGSFRKGLYSTDEQLSDWRKTVVYEDEFTTVNKPSSFEESRNIGNPQWCFCYKNDKWIQHNEIERETIYFVHSLKAPKKWEYNAVCVLPNGDKKVIDGNHDPLSRRNGELFGYLREINGASEVLITDKANNESKTNKNMKKNTIKLNENQLCNIVAESVKKVLKEYYPDKAERDYYAQEVLKTRMEQDRKDTDSCKTELEPFISKLNEKYGDDIVYAALMEIGETMNPYPEN